MIVTSTINEVYKGDTIVLNGRRFVIESKHYNENPKPFWFEPRHFISVDVKLTDAVTGEKVVVNFPLSAAVKKESNG